VLQFSGPQGSLLKAATAAASACKRLQLRVGQLPARFDADCLRLVQLLHLRQHLPQRRVRRRAHGRRVAADAQAAQREATRERRERMQRRERVLLQRQALQTARGAVQLRKAVEGGYVVV
jgi:hypothetical protein